MVPFRKLVQLAEIVSAGMSQKNRFHGEPQSPVLICESCASQHTLGELYRCLACGGELTIRYDYEAIRKAESFKRTWRAPGSLWQRFASLLPTVDPNRIVTLGEGSTPLVEAPALARRFGVNSVYLKLESCNPTGSFKDRQVSLAISKAQEWGRSRFGTASSGNVGVALSAYAAKAGCQAYVWVPSSTAEAKRLQIQVYGARLFLTPPSTKENSALNHAIFTGMREFCTDLGMVPMISARPVNPYMVEGAKTLAFEVVAELGFMPNLFFGPVGGGGLMGSTWKGFRELLELGLVDRLPRMEGAQMSEGHVPIDRLNDPKFDPDLYFRPLDGDWAWQSIQESDGTLRQIDNELIQTAQADLAMSEGVFAEPQGITAFAGLLQAAQDGSLSSGDTVVCVVTGIGLKNMDAACKLVARQSRCELPVHVKVLNDAMDEIRHARNR